MKQGLDKKIKSRGYWRVNFRPAGPPLQLSFDRCKELIRNNSVKLRGWYFPFYRDGQEEHYAVENHNDYISGWIEAGEQMEFWRLYRSGQFLHYAAVDEDWMDGSQDRQFYPNTVKPGKYLNFVGSLTFYLTEIMEFLTRLHKEGLYKNGVTVSISLHNTKGRRLHSFELFRHLSFPRITTEETITFSKKYKPEDLKQKAPDLAIEPIVHFFAMFNFEDISVDQVIKKDQQILYGYTSQER